MLEAPTKTILAWSPQPRQAKLISCQANEVFFGGAKGGGKSDGIIGHFFARAMKYEKLAQGLVLRRTLKGITAFEKRMKEVYGSIFPLKTCWSEQKKRFKFPNGAAVWLNYCDNYNDLQQYQGHEYPFIYPDELPQWEEEMVFEALISINRIGERHESFPRQIIATGNPGGPGSAWVKRRFINFAPAEKITTIEYQTPSGEILKRSRVFIPSKLLDNIYLKGTGYEAALLALPDRLRKMYYEGDWDVSEGQFFDEWDPAVHVCRAFNPPKDWHRWCAMDWGFYPDPCVILWLAQSPSGKIFVYREWTTLDERGEKGTKRPARDVAITLKQIEARTEEHLSERWADKAIYDDDGGENSIGKIFENEGIFWRKARKDKKASSITMLRSLMEVRNGVSQIQIMDNCRYLIATLPALQTSPLHADQYDTNGPDHAVDSLLYGLRKDLAAQEDLDALAHRRARPQHTWGPYGWH